MCVCVCGGGGGGAGVQLHSMGDPQSSAGECYDNNNNTKPLLESGSGPVMMRMCGIDLQWEQADLQWQWLPASPSISWDWKPASSQSRSSCMGWTAPPTASVDLWNKPAPYMTAYFSMQQFYFIFSLSLFSFLLSHHLCRPQRHCFRATRSGIPHLRPHPGLILHCGLYPLRPTGGDVRSLVGCHQETLHCCRVTLAVFSSACSDWTYAGHHLLCPLLATMLAKSQNQTEWASPLESRPPLHPSTNPPRWTLWRWGLWSELSQAREEGGTPRLRPSRELGMKGYRSWDFFSFLFMLWSMIMRMITDDAMEVHFGLRLLHRATDHDYCHNYPGVNLAWELPHLQCWSSN